MKRLYRKYYTGKGNTGNIVQEKYYTKNNVQENGVLEMLDRKYYTGNGWIGNLVQEIVGLEIL